MPVTTMRWEGSVRGVTAAARTETVRAVGEVRKVVVVGVEEKEREEEVERTRRRLLCFFFPARKLFFLKKKKKFLSLSQPEPRRSLSFSFRADQGSAFEIMSSVAMVDFNRKHETNASRRSHFTAFGSDAPRKASGRKESSSDGDEEKGKKGKRRCVCFCCFRAFLLLAPRQ